MLLLLGCLDVYLVRCPGSRGCCRGETWRGVGVKGHRAIAKLKPSFEPGPVEISRFIMENGAKGVEVIISGKLRAQRAKAMKFRRNLLRSPEH